MPQTCSHYEPSPTQNEQGLLELIHSLLTGSSMSWWPLSGLLRMKLRLLHRVKWTCSASCAMRNGFFHLYQEPEVGMSFNLLVPA